MANDYLHITELHLRMSFLSVITKADRERACLVRVQLTAAYECPYYWAGVTVPVLHPSPPSLCLHTGAACEVDLQLNLLQQQQPSCQSGF